MQRLEGQSRTRAGLQIEQQQQQHHHHQNDRSTEQTTTDAPPSSKSHPIRHNQTHPPIVAQTEVTR